MIYNLFEYLNAQFPAYIFVVDGWENEDDTEANLIKQTGGDVAHWYVRQDFTVQFISRSNSKVKAKQRADEVFNFLRNRFGVILPETVVEEVNYPAVTTAQISPLQNPGYIGADQNRNHMYSVNFQITVGG